MAGQGPPNERTPAPGVFVGAGNSGQPVYRMPDGRYSYGAQPDPNYVNALGGRRLTANWVDANEAARKGRVSLVVYDSAIGQPPPTVPPGATIPLTIEEWSIADARRIVFGERGIERVRTGPPCPSCSVHTVPGANHCGACGKRLTPEPPRRRGWAWFRRKAKAG